MKKREILKHFVKANDLELGEVNFSKKEYSFIWPGGLEQSINVIYGSAKFAGFCDGFQGHRNKYDKRAKGSSQSNASKHSLIEDLISKFYDHELPGEFRSIFGGMKDVICLDYVSQYELGRITSRNKIEKKIF